MAINDVFFRHRSDPPFAGQTPMPRPICAVAPVTIPALTLGLAPKTYALDEPRGLAIGHRTRDLHRLAVRRMLGFIVAVRLHRHRNMGK